MSNSHLSIALDFIVVAKTIKETIKEQAKKYGLGAPEFLVMHRMYEERTIAQRDLTDTDYIAKPFNYVLKKLEEGRFIEHGVDAEDKRVRIVTLTPEGAEAYEKILAEVLKYIGFAVEGAGTEADRQTTSITTRAIARNIKNTFC